MRKKISQLAIEELIKDTGDEDTNVSEEEKANEEFENDPDIKIVCEQMPNPKVKKFHFSLKKIVIGFTWCFSVVAFFWFLGFIFERILETISSLF